MSRATGIQRTTSGKSPVEFENILTTKRDQDILGETGRHSLDELDLERERKRKELYLEERQAEFRTSQHTPTTSMKIEILDEKELQQSLAKSRGESGGLGVRSLFKWAPTSSADQRLQHAAKEMGEAIVVKAGEIKDRAVNSLGKYKTYLPGRFGMTSTKTSQNDWERYGAKMDKVNRLLVKAERKTFEARNAPPTRSAELYVQSNLCKQKALNKALKAQQIAQAMERSSEERVNTIKCGIPTKRDIWELYGATKVLTQELIEQAEELMRQSNATSEKLKATELRNNAIHLRKKALRKAEKTHTFAQEILKQNEAKITELKSTDRSGLVTAEALK